MGGKVFNADMASGRTAEKATLEGRRRFAADRDFAIRIRKNLSDFHVILDDKYRLLLLLAIDRHKNELRVIEKQHRIVDGLKPIASV